MARYQLTLAYDGTDFFGSQRQANRRTVQGEFEKALSKLGWTGRSVLMSGRTDTGVHATGQVASCDLDWSHTDEELVKALNATLPTGSAKSLHGERRLPSTFRCHLPLLSLQVVLAASAQSNSGALCLAGHL